MDREWDYTEAFAKASKRPAMVGGTSARRRIPSASQSVERTFAWERLQYARFQFEKHLAAFRRSIEW
jgi:hypothetical protein